MKHVGQVWGITILVAAALFLFSPSRPSAADEEATVFYVTRHMDRDGHGADALIPQGMFRAAELAFRLRDGKTDAEIDAVLSTRTIRTWQTAMPTALAYNRPIVPYESPVDWKTWGTEMITTYAGRSVLIAGHSNTVNDIVRGLGGTGNYPASDFGALYVVTIKGGQARVEEHYIRALEHLGPIEGLESIFKNQPDAEALRENISAATGTRSGGLLLLGTDRRAHIQVLKRENGAYGVGPVIVLNSATDELDIEAITRHDGDGTFFVLGSHSWRRKSVDGAEWSSKPYAKVKERFEQESPQRLEERDLLIRLTIDATTGNAVSTGSPIPLRDLLEAHRVLQPFMQSHLKDSDDWARNVPANENGIDIEGLTSDGEWLFLGFRGPVLRHGYTPVLRTRPTLGNDGNWKLESPTLLYVDLDGRGIREIVSVSDGFLIIAGALGDSDLPFRLYHWDGRDCLPGRRGPGEPTQGRVESLGIVPTRPGEHAEALFVSKVDAAAGIYELIIGYDGPSGGNLTRYRAQMKR